MVTKLQPGDRLLLYSADNPDAAYLVAGMLQRRCPWLGAVVLRDAAGAGPSEAVREVLTEHEGEGARSPVLDAGAEAEPFDVGIILCVPT
jgi:hypothetical protein